MELAGKTALITGGAQGIGAASARLFTEQGANVAVADINGELLTRLQSEFSDVGGEMLAIEADFGRLAGIEGAVEQTVSRIGGLDIVVCGAIYRPTKTVDEVTKTTSIWRGR